MRSVALLTITCVAAIAIIGVLLLLVSSGEKSSAGAGRMQGESGKKWSIASRERLRASYCIVRVPVDPFALIVVSIRAACW